VSKIQVVSEPALTWGPSPAAALADVLARAEAMGLLRTASGRSAAGHPAGGLAELQQALRRHSIGGDAARALDALVPARRGAGTTSLQAALAALDAPAQQALAQQLRRVTEALEDSAVPAAEWPAMRGIFGDEMLGSLLEVSPASLRRYAGGTRATPQSVADRLHWLALVVADLAGAYNDFGMRRWFERPRSQLGGKSPRQLLGRGWHVDGEAARKVRALASVLRGANPLAA
jgi:hypothetical protein